MDLLFGSLAIGLPVLLVIGIAWSEGVLGHWTVYVIFSIAAIIFFVRYMNNLEEWQMGLFGLLFALAIVGLDRMFGRK
jgi:type II secretory pathway component PulF